MENESWYLQSSDAAQPEQEGQTEFFLSCVRGEKTWILVGTMYLWKQPDIDQ